MQKRIILVLSISLLLIIFAGCNKENNIKIEKQVIDKIELLTASDKDRLLVANINNKKTVLDYNGNQLYVIEDSYDNINIMNKYVYSVSENKSYVYNKSGDINLIKGKINSISKSGFALIERDSKNKDYNNYEIIDLNTTEKVKKYNNNDFSLISYSEYKDYFLIESDDIEELFDAKRKISYDNYFDNNDYIEKEGKALKDEVLPYQDNKGKILSIKNNLYYFENKIYDKNYKEIKTLEEGNIKYIHYYKDKILVYTDTNNIYILNKDLEYILEPTNIENTDLSFLLDFKEDFNAIINNDNIFGYNYSVQIKDNAIFIIRLMNEEAIKEVEIQIIDNESLDKKLSYNIKVNSDQDIKVTNNALIINDADNNLYIINKKGKKVFKNSKGKVFSDKIITIKSNKQDTIYNIEKMKKLEIVY